MSKDLTTSATDRQNVLNNPYLYCTSSFLREMENISYHVAAGNIDKALLHDLIAAHLAEESDNESLKLRVLNAIKNSSRDDQGMT